MEPPTWVLSAHTGAWGLGDREALQTSVPATPSPYQGMAVRAALCSKCRFDSLKLEGKPVNIPLPDILSVHWPEGLATNSGSYGQRRARVKLGH